MTGAEDCVVCNSDYVRDIFQALSAELRATSVLQDVVCVSIKVRGAGLPSTQVLRSWFCHIPGISVRGRRWGVTKLQIECSYPVKKFEYEDFFYYAVWTLKQCRNLG